MQIQKVRVLVPLLSLGLTLIACTHRSQKAIPVPAGRMLGVAFPADKSCIAWQARAKVFWFRTETPIGLNCVVRAKVTEIYDDHLIHVESPIFRFDSAELKRDADVMSILKTDAQPNLIYDSDSIDTSTWQSLLAGTKATLSGKLTIGGTAFPVSFDLQRFGQDGDAIIEGVAHARLRDFKIEPPKVAFGLIADVQNEVALYVHMVNRDVVGL